MHHSITTGDARHSAHQAFEELYRAVVEQVSDGIFLADARGQYIEVNPRGCELLGYPSVELLSLSWREVILADGAAHDLPPGAGLPAGSVECRLRRKDGRALEVEVSSRLLADGRVLSIVRDIGERRRASKLHDALEALREAEQIARIGSYVYDIPADRWTSSPTLDDIFGIGADFDRSSAGWGRLIHPSQQDEMMAYLRDTISQRRRFEREYRIVRASDGVDRWVMGRGEVEYDADGSPLRMVGMILDITERKRSENLLRTRLHLSELAQHCTLDELIQVIVDEAESYTDSRIGFFHFVDADQEHLSLQTWSTNTLLYMCRAEGRGKHYPVSEAGLWADCIDTRQPVIHNDYASLPHKKGLPAGHAPVVRELVVPILRDQQVVAIIGLGNKPVDYTQDDVQVVQLLAATVTDLVERKHAEEELRKNEEQLRQAREAADLGTWRHDLVSGDVLFDTRARAHYGIDTPVVTFADVLARVHPDDINRLQQQIAASLDPAGTGHYAVDYRVVHPGGAVRWLAVQASIYFEGTGAARRPYLRIGISQDITERKRIEEELRRSNADLEQFAYVASHDLQEPLRAVAGMVQLLQQRYQGQIDARADQYIAHAVEGATRMQTLINDLLTFSRVDTRARPFAPTDMGKVLRSALANLTVAIRESGAIVTHDELPTVIADASQLVQLLQNLIGNAIKFHGPQPPAIHIGAERRADAWCFVVRDNGIGIEPQYFERIFIVFQRLHTRREYPGTGIGLAICKKIVERHGGRIWVESAPGQGALFFFTIPHRRQSDGR